MKPRSDSKLLNLPEAQMAQLSDWLMSGLPQAKVKLLVKSEFGVDTSAAALTRFYSEVCSAALLARRRRAVSTSEEVAEDAAKSPGQFDAATIDRLKQMAFEMTLSPQPDARNVKNLFGLVLKARDQDLEARRVALLEQKLKETEKVVGDEKLSAQEKEARIKNVFGIQ